MEVFSHLLYEYKKGLRDLGLHTFHPMQRLQIEERLKNMGVDYLFQKVNSQKMNVFFGDDTCVSVIRQFGNIRLSDYTPEQDFILGIMLGYNRQKQCQRYLKFTDSSTITPDQKMEICVA